MTCAPVVVHGEHAPPLAVVPLGHTSDPDAHVALTADAVLGDLTRPALHVEQVAPPVVLFCTWLSPHAPQAVAPEAYCADPHAAVAATQVALASMAVLGSLTIPFAQLVHAVRFALATVPTAHRVQVPLAAYCPEPQTVDAATQVALTAALLSGHLTMPVAQAAHAVGEVLLRIWPYEQVVHVPVVPNDCAVPHAYVLLAAYTHVAFTTLVANGTLTDPKGQYEQVVGTVVLATWPLPQEPHWPDEAYCAEPHTVAAATQVALATVPDAGHLTVPLGQVVQAVGVVVFCTWPDGQLLQ